MSRQIQIRRGTAAEHTNFTGAIGEITMDTTNKTLRIHDGETPGGTVLAKQSEIVTPPHADMTDYVIAMQMPTAANNYTWYRKYKSGWIEQGGITNNDSILFPIQFSNNCYTILGASAMLNPDAGTISICYSNKTDFGIIIQLRWNGAAATGERSWYAAGY